MEGTVDDRWKIILRLEDSDEHPEAPPVLASLTVERIKKVDALTAVAWRSIAVGEITDEALSIYRDAAEHAHRLAELKDLIWDEEQ